MSIEEVVLRSVLLIIDMPRWFICIMCGSGFFAYYYTKAVQPPQLSCLPGQYKTFLETNVPLLKQKFWPTIWCFESRLQTVFASILRKQLNVSYKREIINLCDGGRVAIDWVVSDKFKPTTPMILILPGITGSSATDYVKGLCLSGTKAGFRCIVFNNRGIGLPLLTPVTYCATKTDDVAASIKHIKERFPNAPLAATGISMGGLILGNYLSSKIEKEDCNICSAMLISVPFDVFKASNSMEQFPLNMMLNRHLVSCLKKIIQSSENILDGSDKPYKLNEVINSRTVREFDINFTSKVFGYKNVDEYYADASVLSEKFANIKTPLICLQAADDPFQPLDDDIQNILEHDRNNIAIVVTARGGHIAFMEGLWPVRGDDEYMDRFFTQFFTAMFKDDIYKQFASD